MRFARPNPVRTISAPAACACLATSNAIDSRLMTPVIRSFLPLSMTPPSRRGNVPPGEFPHGMRARSASHHAASNARTTLWPPNPNAFEIASGVLSPMSSGCASLGT